MSAALATLQILLRCNAPSCTQAVLVVMSTEFFERYFEATDVDAETANASYEELARHHSMYHRAGWKARSPLGLDFCVHHHDFEPKARVPEVWLEPSR